jgi:hypothetical protein
VKRLVALVVFSILAGCTVSVHHQLGIQKHGTSPETNAPPAVTNAPVEPKPLHLETNSTMKRVNL